ncbi:MAG TPA: ComF family protein [Vicinamibacterales bacterium]|nr:ComF family protein [Vicinamibacterales bacterium]
MVEWLDALLAVLLAPTCGACGLPLVHPSRGCICSACWNAIVAVHPPLCDRCGDRMPTPPAAPGTIVCPRCVRTPSAVSRSRAIGPYAGTLRSIVHALKYDGRRSVSSRLASLMRAAGADMIADCAAAVPVPLHPARLRSRGFNQADDLARHLGLPVVRALVRIRHTDTQTALPAGERQANVAGAFEVNRRARALRGVAIVLVDDVRTTGATLEACALALRASGVRDVYAVTAARVETPGL